jgi:hypothetical protein
VRRSSEWGKSIHVSIVSRDFASVSRLPHRGNSLLWPPLFTDFPPQTPAVHSWDMSGGFTLKPWATVLWFHFKKSFSGSHAHQFCSLKDYHPQNVSHAFRDHCRGCPFHCAWALSLKSFAPTSFSCKNFQLSAQLPHFFSPSSAQTLALAMSMLSQGECQLWARTLLLRLPGLDPSSMTFSWMTISKWQNFLLLNFLTCPALHFIYC